MRDDAHVCRMSRDADRLAGATCESCGLLLCSRPEKLRRAVVEPRRVCDRSAPPQRDGDSRPGGQTQWCRWTRLAESTHVEGDVRAGEHREQPHARGVHRPGAALRAPCPACPARCGLTGGPAAGKIPEPLRAAACAVPGVLRGHPAAPGSATASRARAAASLHRRCRPQAARARAPRGARRRKRADAGRGGRKS